MGDVKISGGDLEKIVNEAAMKLFDFCDSDICPASHSDL